MKTELWNGYKIRFVEKDGEWWAVAADVTKALGIRNTSQAINGNVKTGARGLKEKDKGIYNLDTPGGIQEVLIINENGIFKLIFKSHKQEAENFQDWVYEMLKTLRQSTGLEGFQIFRMLDKEHQKEAMQRLHKALKEPKRVNFIKANMIANKAVSTRYGFKKMIKKAEMTPEMLVDREELLDDTVQLMEVKEKYGLDISVSDEVYKIAREANQQTA